MLLGLRVAAQEAPCLGCRFGILWAAPVFGNLTIVHQSPCPAFGQQLELKFPREGNPIPVPSQGAVECGIGSSLGCGSESLQREPCLWEHHWVSWEMQSLSQAFPKW